MSSRTSILFSVLWFLLGLVLFTGVLIGGRDALTHDPAMLAQAREVACAEAARSPAPARPSGDLAGRPADPAPACTLQMTRWESTLLRRAVELESGATRVRVQCSRRYLLTGEYECHPAL